MRGVIRPNGYVQHFHGDIHFASPREFVVDPKAEKVVDEKGKPLILTTKVWEELKKKLGGPLVCEPIGGLAGVASAARISELEHALELAQKRIAELEAKLDAGKAKK